MTDEAVAAPAARSPGLLASAKIFLATLLDVASTRLDLLVTELEEEKLRFEGMLAWGALTLLFGALALVFLSLLVVAAFWDTHRVAALVCVTVAYLALAVTCGRQLRLQHSRKSRLFSASLDELRKDQEGMQ